MARNIAGMRGILTGASSGIGRALAVELATAGARLALMARSADKLSDLVNELTDRGADAVAVTGDVTVAADRERVVAEAVGRFGGLDLLVNVAGAASFGHFATSTEAINRQVMEVNFFAPVELTRLAMSHLTDGNDSAIVYLTSMCGRRGMPAWPEYSASKFALVGMAEAFKAEFARFKVGVTTVVPGLTRTEWASHLLRNDGKMDIPYDQGMPTEEVARRTVESLRADRGEVVLGREAKRILWMNKFAPRVLNRLIARKVRKLYAE